MYLRHCHSLHVSVTIGYYKHWCTTPQGQIVCRCDGHCLRTAVVHLLPHRSVVPAHIMKAYKGSRGIHPLILNRLTPNDPYMGRTAPLTSKRCILYIYSRNIGTEYFKHALHSPFFSLQNAVCFIMLTCLVPVLFTFCIQGVLKFKK